MPKDKLSISIFNSRASTSHEKDAKHESTKRRKTRGSLYAPGQSSQSDLQRPEVNEENSVSRDKFPLKSEDCDEKEDYISGSSLEDKKLSGEIDEGSNRKLLRLKNMKRKRSFRSSGILNDEQISVDEFAKSSIVLENARNSYKSIETRRASPILGLVPFVAKTQLDESTGKSRQSLTHLSFDEDKEEDMFADTKEEEKVEEISSFDAKNLVSPTTFHGFSSYESECSQKVAIRCGQFQKSEDTEDLETHENSLRGFTTSDLDRNVENSKTWNSLVKMYFSDSIDDIIGEGSVIENLDEKSLKKESENGGKSDDSKFQKFSVDNDKLEILDTLKAIGRVFPAKSIDDSEKDSSKNVDSQVTQILPKFSDSKVKSSFSTIGGRSIPANEEAIATIRKMYKDVEVSRLKDKNENPRIKDSKNKSDLESVSFKTAKGTEIQISEKALSRAKAQFDLIRCDNSENSSDIEFENIENSLPDQFSSSDFKTAGGKELKISQEALSRAETHFKDIREEIIENFTVEQENEQESHSLAFKTAGGKQLKISQEALSRAKGQYDEIKDELIEVFPEKKNESSLNFKTAGGKSLKISEEALSRAKEQFEKISNELSQKTAEVIENDWKKASKKESKISPETFSRAKVQFDKIKDDCIESLSDLKNSSSLGFKTAGGKNLKISEEALSKAKVKFAEIDDELNLSQNKDEIIIDNLKCETSEVKERKIKNLGFQTAGGKELKISQEALAKAKAQYHEIEVELDEKSAESSTKVDVPKVAFPKTSCGFSTANGHTINITAEALATAEEKFAVDLNEVEGLNIEDFEEDFAEPMDQSESSKKRKFEDIDDDTPARKDSSWKRKRGRDTGDLQGRKLFDEDHKMINESPTIFRSNPRITKSQKVPISEEIDASAAALIEDEEITLKMTSSKNSNVQTKNHEMPIVATATSDPSKSSSSTIQKIKRKNSIDSQHESIPDDLTFDSQFSQDQSQTINKFIVETMKIMEARLAMALKQDEAVRAKRRTKPLAQDGSLYQTRISNKDSRISWNELTEGNGPVPRENCGQSIGFDVSSVTSASAASYSFCCADFYGEKNVRTNVEGIKVGDDAFLILDEKNCAGAREFERAFLASPGVDPNLVPAGWVRNHYRWIVWKLASMDRVKFGRKCLPRMLTPDRVMLELKYRYDREIYRSQWPPLRRILEKNEDSSARLVLCVASVILEEKAKTPVASSTPGSYNSTMCEMRLTDGWYSIAATVDIAMINLIKSGKIREGTKIITFGARVMNLDQGCSALEIPGNVTLRIHTNSTRRIKWNTKMDFYRPNSGPMSLSLKTVKPNGGAICKLVVAVARLYPILYREKLPDGQFVFRNARCDEEAARAHESGYQSKIEEIYANACNDFHSGSASRHREEEIREMIASKLSECLPPPRDVTPVMKIRIAEGDTSAMMTVWSTDRDNAEFFAEGSSVVIYNGFASWQRSNELQITAGRSTFFKPENARRIIYPERIFTSLMDIGEPGFNPIYGEFDTVGIVSSSGAAPHGMKNFETVNLACPRQDDEGTSDFLSVLFWQGVSTHGYSKILTVGTLVACSNLEWRRNTSRSIPTAYCTERSVFSKNPRQAHLSRAFETLRHRIKDPVAYAVSSASLIKDEIAKKSALRTPGNGTPYKAGSTMYNNNATPGWSPRDLTGAIDANVNQTTPRNEVSRKSSIMRRIEKLEVYGEPPKLPTIVINNSSKNLSSVFRSPILTPTKKS